MNQPEKWDEREVNGAIMDFQKHVREVTGGSNRPIVDCTPLKRAIDKTVKLYGEQRYREGMKFATKEVSEQTVFWEHQAQSELLEVLEGEVKEKAVISDVPVSETEVMTMDVVRLYDIQHILNKHKK